jgi:hypothetical protein
MKKDYGFTSAICEKADRNASQSQKEGTPDKIKNGPKSKLTLCPAKYKIKFNSEKVLKVYEQNEWHNHPIFEVNYDLDEEMIEELKTYPSNTKISTIVKQFKSKYRREFGYAQIYREFRKINIKFGPSDAENLFSQLRDKGFLFSFLLDSNRALSKLIFTNNAMKEDYFKYRDVVLMDSTYKTNKYAFPVVVISGMNRERKIIIFAIAIINNETTDTYSWLLQNFIQLMDNRHPHLIVTDQDLAMTAALETISPQSRHFICQWHNERNFTKHFAFLSVKNPELRRKLMSLQSIEDRDKFNQIIADAKSYLALNKLNNTLRYIHRINEIREKWAVAYQPLIFNAGVLTTSQSESINSFIKKHLNSISEFSAIFEFLNEWERSLSSRILQGFSTKNPLSKHPIIEKLLQIYTPRIIDFHQEQIALSLRYKIELREGNIYEAKHIDHPDAPPREITLSTGIEKFHCSCLLFEREGILCRHIFKLLISKDISDLDNVRICQRWTKTYSDDINDPIVLDEITTSTTSLISSSRIVEETGKNSGTPRKIGKSLFIVDDKEKFDTKAEYLETEEYEDNLTLVDTQTPASKELKKDIAEVKSEKKPTIFHARGNQLKAEREKAEREIADRKKTEQEKAEKDIAEKEIAEIDKIEREKTELQKIGEPEESKQENAEREKSPKKEKTKQNQVKPENTQHLESESESEKTEREKPKPKMVESQKPEPGRRNPIRKTSHSYFQEWRTNRQDFSDHIPDSDVE